MQGLLDSYYAKALAAGEDEGRQQECTKLAVQIVDALHALLPARTAEKRAAAAAAAAAAASRTALHVRPKQGAGRKDARKGKAAGAGKTGSDAAGKHTKGQVHVAAKQKHKSGK